MPRTDKDDHFDEYVKYAKHSRGLPEEFDTWALDNGIKLPPKKDVSDRDQDDFTE